MFPQRRISKAFDRITWRAIALRIPLPLCSVGAGSCRPNHLHKCSNRLVTRLTVQCQFVGTPQRARPVILYGVGPCEDFARELALLGCHAGEVRGPKDLAFELARDSRVGHDPIMPRV